MNTPFPYVLFDLGNTLIYFEGVWNAVIDEMSHAMTRSLRSLGYQLDEQGFPAAYRVLSDAYYNKRDEEFIEYSSLHVLEEALRSHSIPDPKPQDMRVAIQAMYSVSQAHWHIERDTIPMLEALRASGRRLGIISNATDDEDVQTLVDNAGIRPYFDFVISSAAFGRRKPGGEIFKQALSYWNALPTQAAMVGDTLSADILGANWMGIASVWIRRRADTPENRANLATIRPQAVIDTLAELPDLLDRPSFSNI